MAFQVIKQIHFCYGHRLLNYQGKCRNLHGHNGQADIVLEGDTLDDLGMVTDFSKVKKIMKGWIDQHLDHKMILCKDDPLAPLLLAEDQPVHLLECNPTAEALARLLHQVALDNDFPVVEVRFWESPTSIAVYRP